MNYENEVGCVKIGIVILNYNKSELVKSMAEKISLYRNIDYVVIVDNNSKDNSREVFAGINNSKIVVIYSDCNGGYAKGNNIGLRYLVEKLSCDVVFVANPDVEFGEDVIKCISNSFEKYDEYAIISSARTDDSGKSKCLQYSKAFDTFALQFFNSFILSSYILKKLYYSFDVDKSKDIITVDEIPGAFWAAKSSVLKKIGYMDEGTFLFCEELCLSKKIKNAGYKEGIVTAVKYRHNHYTYSTTVTSSVDKKTRRLRNLKFTIDSRNFFRKKYLKLNKIQKKLLIIADKWCFFERKFF